MLRDAVLALILALGICRAEVTPKRLQLLKDAIPRLARVAALWSG